MFPLCSKLSGFFHPLWGPAAGKPLYEAQYSDFLRCKFEDLGEFWRNWRNYKKIFAQIRRMRRRMRRICAKKLKKYFNIFLIFWRKKNRWYSFAYTLMLAVGIKIISSVRFAKKCKYFAHFLRRRMRTSCAQIAPCMYIGHELNIDM